MLDPTATERLASIAGGVQGGDQRRSDVGAFFQLALLAAGQGNDQEAGDYLRQIITAMKSMVGPRRTDAGSGPNP